MGERLHTDRIIIAGGPRSGKTTLSETYKDVIVHHTDDLIEMFEWSEASDRVAELIAAPGPWVIEGTIAVRGLRKFIVKYPNVKPCEKVIFRAESYVELTSQQKNMANGCWTIFTGIAKQLGDLGVEIQVDIGYGFV